MPKSDKQAIRQLVDDWFTATKRGDVKKVLSLMTDDVLFMVPGQEPFGKKEFQAASEKMNVTEIDGKSDIQEIKVLGDWAYMRNYLEVTMEQKTRSGYTLTILTKGKDGQWRISRDANLLMEDINWRG